LNGAFKTSVVFVVFSLFLLAGVSRAQETNSTANAQQTGTTAGPDCLAHPEATGCLQSAKPGTKTPAPSLEQLPTTIPVITPISSEAAGEGGKPATAKAPFQPEPPPPPTEFQLESHFQN